MAESRGLSTIRETFSQRNFRIYVSGSSVSLIGTWVHRIAVGWLTWELTHSYIWLGAMGFAELFPIVFFGPLAGAIADRVDRLRLAMVSQAGACVQAVILAALVIFDAINVWVLFGFTVALGCMYVFGTMARLTIFPALVERPYLSQAIAINAAFFNLARFLGPAIGGGVIAQWGVGVAFAFNAATFVWFVFTLSRIRLLFFEQRAGGRRGLVADVAEGVRYAIRHPGLGPALLVLVAMAVGVKGFPELLPGFVDTVLGRGVEAFAQLTAATGIGAGVSAVWVALRGRMAGLATISVLSLLAGTVAIFAFAVLGSFYFGLVLLAVAGASITVVGTATQSLMQNAVAGEMRGRVMSLYGILFRGGPALSMLILGTIAEFAGLQVTMAVSAAIAMAGGCLLWTRRKAMIAALEAEPAPRPCAEEAKDAENAAKTEEKAVQGSGLETATPHPGPPPQGGSG